MNKRKEIGSDFWSVPVVKTRNHIFDKATWFISGRAAFRAILRQIKIEMCATSLKVALPSFLCESMVLPLEKESIEYTFYPVEMMDNNIVCDYSIARGCNAILIMDYFGFESNESYIRDSNIIVIRDLTHSLFIKDYTDADYYFGSLRKWAGFVGGGFAYRSDGRPLEKPTASLKEYESIKKKAIDAKAEYMHGVIETKDYLSLFYNAEMILDGCDVVSSESNDAFLAEHLDVDLIKKRRRTNASVLIGELKDYCLFKKMGKQDCPLCVPIVFKKREALRRYLISKDIYCPIHWPKPNQITDDLSKSLYETELSLVCDHRYTKEDMRRIVCEIKAFMENDRDA